MLNLFIRPEEKGGFVHFRPDIKSGGGGAEKGEDTYT